MSLENLRPYQRTIALKVLRALDDDFEKIPVMAMATGTGKTITACAIIGRYLHRYPSSRVLVLTHNQVVLRRNFQSNGVLPSFEITSAADVKDSLSHRVVVAIPSSIAAEVQNAGAFDLVVVDEAHEHWSAPRVQTILQHLGSPKQLLMTASHSVFPRARYRKYFYSVLEGLDDGVLPKVAISLLGAHLDIDLDDYDANDDLNDAVAFEEEQVRDLCDELSQRLLSLGGGSLPKTMIICHSVAMACSVFRGLQELHPNGIEISVSPNAGIEAHLCDPEARNLERFRRRQNPRVIVVAQRGVLGFDCESMEVVVDLSGTRNIERNRQHLGRLLRKSANARAKTFVKVVPHDMEYYGLYLMGAVVALTHPDNDIMYEGDPKVIRIATTPRKKVSVRVPRRIKWWRDRSLTLDCPILDPEEYRARLNPRQGGGRVLWDIAFTDLEAVKEFERGDAVAKNARLITYATSGHPRPIADAKEVEERVLGRHLVRLCRKGTKSEHAPTLERLRQIRPDWFKRLPAQERWYAYARSSGETALGSPAKLEESRALRFIFDTYARKGGRRFDAAFRAQLIKQSPEWFFECSDDRVDLVIALAADEGPKMEHTSLRKMLTFCDPHERGYDQRTHAAVCEYLPGLLEDATYLAKQQLYRLAQEGAPRPHHLIPGQATLALTLAELTLHGPRHEMNFTAALRKLREDWFIQTGRHGKNKAVLLAMARSSLCRQPGRGSLDPEEVRLAKALSGYCDPVRKGFDPVFTAVLRETRPDWLSRPEAR